jgi:hypothetical protein
MSVLRCPSITTVFILFKFYTVQSQMKFPANT